jgi:hypothetical protein
MGENKDLALSTITCIVVMLLCSQTIDEQIIKPRLYDGTINQLGRYSFTYDGYEYISEESDFPVIAIGTSRMREIFDGISIGENSSSGADFFNLAYGMDLPYIRMIEIDYLIDSNPSLVIIEMGPSSFSKLDNSVWHYNRTIDFMSHLISMKPFLTEPDWIEYISEADADKLPLTYMEQKAHWADYGQDSFESTMEYEFNNTEARYDCGRNGHVRCVPLTSSKDYDNYIRYPYQLPNVLAHVKATGTIINSNGNPYSMPLEKYYGPYLNNSIKNPYHNPEDIRNINHNALDFIIEKLVTNNIEVMLVGIPYNPVLLDRLEDGKWDYYNQSMMEYSEDSRITVVDFMWESDWQDDYFSDLAHASRSGELYFTSKITSKIDEIIA